MLTIQDLKDRNLILLECISGSRAYGLDTPESDTDIKGVFYLPKEQFYGPGYIEQVSGERNDEVYYELGRFVALLAKNNPNILELLATPEQQVLYRHPLMERFQPGLVLSRLCKETFAGYAMTQVRKARGYKKKVVNPVDAVRRQLTDFCYIVTGASSQPLKAWLAGQGRVQERCGLAAVLHAKGLYTLFYDADDALGYKGITGSEASNDVSLSSVPKGEAPVAHLFFNAEAYSAYCREYREYWDWVGNRNEARYAGNQAHGKDYDAKNMMHTIRLLQVAEEILREGRLKVRRPNREELLAIKRGDWAYEDLLMRAEDLMAQIAQAEASSPLPEKPDAAALEQVLVAVRTELYEGIHA